MQPIPRPRRNRDILLLAFSLLSMAVLMGRGIYQVIASLPDYKSALNDLSSSLFDAIGMFFCAALLLPLIIFTIQKLIGREIRLAKLPPVKLWQVGVFIVIWLFAIILGSVIADSTKDGEFIAIPFFVLGIAIPVAGLVWIAVGGLPAGSWQRFWAAFSIGMTGSTVGAILLEYSVVGIGALAAGIIASSNPQWLTVFHQVESQVTKGGGIQNLLNTLAPYLTNPLILILALLFAAVLAPLFEETLKPLAVWLLGKRLHSLAEGFALGALCGAGFALLEGTLAASADSQMLGLGITARAASSLMHITASGLMGWGIASARLEKRYGRLIGIYFLSVSIHGMWNASVVLAIFGALRLSVLGASTDLLGMLLVLAGIGILTFMLITIIILLPIINHLLRPKANLDNLALPSVIIAPPQP